MRRFRATFSTCTPVCSSAPRTSPRKRAAAAWTALPIVETQAGDVSAYIPTNIISITDGQIFLESDLFFSGQRPAVNVGLSVSRVGGAAQTKAMKKAAGTLRLDLAQYREMEVFTQFSSDLDEMTKRQLAYGQSLMRLLRQAQYQPMSQHEQVITLIAAQEHIMQEVPLAQVNAFQKALVASAEQKEPDLCARTTAPASSPTRTARRSSIFSRLFSPSIRKAIRSSERYGRYKGNQKPDRKRKGYKEDHQRDVPDRLHKAAQGEKRA